MNTNHITNLHQLEALVPTDHSLQPVVITLKGRVYKIRRMSGFAFLILQLPKGLLQCTWLPELIAEHCAAENLPVPELPVEQACITLTGRLVAEPRSRTSYEVQVLALQILSTPAEELPVVINNKSLDMNLETRLDYRPITLRHEKERAIFRIQEGICAAVREYLSGQDFTEIHSPKLVAEGAEGGSNIFRLDYFGREAYLAQSPQFYKQTMVGVYGRVFEIAPVYRAEHHDTSRHLNEYIGVDLEMGYIENFTEIMDTEEAMLRHVLAYLATHCAEELALCKVTLPTIPATGIPRISFREAKELVSEEYRRSSEAGELADPNDLAPEEERLIGQYAGRPGGLNGIPGSESDFVFVTHYPTAKRPFYAMEDPANPEVTLSFDLLFRGLEITTGGQRIHSYQEQIRKMESRGMDPANFASYLMIHRYGMPPHGGLGIGLERLTACLLGFPNVRQASLFPRDIHRLTP